MSIDVNTTLEDIEAMLTDEDHKETEFQQICGKRAPNIIISEIGKEASKYEEGHRKASQSNADLHKAMNEHISRLKLLAGPLEELQAYIPSLEAIRSKCMNLIHVDGAANANVRKEKLIDRPL